MLVLDKRKLSLVVDSLDGVSHPTNTCEQLEMAFWRDCVSEWMRANDGWLVCRLMFVCGCHTQDAAKMIKVKMRINGIVMNHWVPTDVLQLATATTDCKCIFTDGYLGETWAVKAVRIHAILRAVNVWQFVINIQSNLHDLVIHHVSLSTERKRGREKYPLKGAFMVHLVLHMSKLTAMLFLLFVLCSSTVYDFRTPHLLFSSIQNHTLLSFYRSLSLNEVTNSLPDDTIFVVVGHFAKVWYHCAHPKRTKWNRWNTKAHWTRQLADGLCLYPRSLCVYVFCVRFMGNLFRHEQK